MFASLVGSTHGVRKQGWPPVQRAIPGDYLNVLELLVRNGVNLCPTDPDGNTLLHVAVMYSASTCFFFLPFVQDLMHAFLFP